MSFRADCPECQDCPKDDTSKFLFDKSKTKWCRGPLKLIDPPGPVTALASWPGSGNTWMRYLLQQATGFVTGCVYVDHSLKNSQFPGKSSNVKTIFNLRD